MRKYKVSELASILGITEQAIRSKIKRNILPSIEESVGNRLITLIPLDDFDLDELVSQTNRNKNIYSTVGSTIERTANNISQSVAQEKNETISKSEENSKIAVANNIDNNILMEKLAELAQKAGKYELLEDKSKEYKQDIQYWQSKFFEKENEIKELIRENEALKLEKYKTEKQLEALKAELANKNKEIKEERKRPFWKRKVL